MQHHTRLTKAASVLMALVMLLSLVPTTVFAASAAPTAAAPDAVISLTVSQQGVPACAKDGSTMANRPVTVKDLNADGKLTVDEALVAAHETYLTKEGYATSTSGYGTSVSRLWGVDTSNTLFFVNNVGIASGVGVDTVQAGDALVASINKDNTYFADWYTFFDANTVTVSANESFSLQLKGHLGMAYTPEDQADVVLPGLSVGTWDNGVFTALEGKTTDAEGRVTLSFPQPGTYCITAAGTVKDQIQDWSQGGSPVDADCPIIAPVCVVTVEDSTPGMSDAEAVAKIHQEFSDIKYANALIFPMEYNGETYTNVLDYIKAWAKQETGRNVTIQYTAKQSTTNYKEWNTGSLVNQSYCGLELNGDITQGYFKDNGDKRLNQLTNVTFTIGDQTSENIKSIYIQIKSLQRSPQEIVNYVAENMCFARIQNGNASQEQICVPVGEHSGSSVTLPNTSDLYGTSSVSVTWTLKPISGDAKALTLRSNKTSVLRPNVGEENAVFDLTAEITSKADKSVSRQVTHRLTVPAFESAVIPIQVPSGATLSLTDNYYKTAVDSKYLQKQAGAPEGYDLYLCTLHTSAIGDKQTFKYQVSKPGFITKSGSFDVTGTTTEAMIFSLNASSQKDTQLASLEILAPTVTGFRFDPNVTDYTVQVKGAQKIELGGTLMTEEANAKITAYYRSVKDANAGKVSTTGTFKVNGTSCYLPDDVSDSVIEVTVTAPEGSTLTEKSRVYRITVQKTAPTGPLTSLSLSASSSMGGTKNNYSEDFSLPAEETFSPSFIAGAHEDCYNYYVNYWRDQIKVKPTAPNCTITVNGTEVASGKNSDPINLAVGDNRVEIVTTKDGTSTTYTLNIHRKAELKITDITLAEGEISTPMPEGAPTWSNACNFAWNSNTVHVTYHTNLESAEEKNVTVHVQVDGKVYTGKAGAPIEIPVGSAQKLIPSVWLLYTPQDGTVTEGCRYVISLNRKASEGPSAVTSYLPAPGQFVNLPSYQNPEAIGQLITLGSFGGNVVYQFDNPITNDPKAPYGVDFIITGNAFTNSDGTTAAAAAEPAAVMVSQDGTTWYELAGSQYYNADTTHHLTVTYQNGDPAFTAAADTAWSDSLGNSGILPKNGFHNQPYYPDPAYYMRYQTGIGKNDTYTKDTVSFTGTKLGQRGFFPFGYADSHAEAAGQGNAAANPYIKEHSVTYNSDGFDLSWAVDSNGDPVALEQISYVKIYNPLLTHNSSTGEASPEIQTVMSAKLAADPVGKSSGLQSLQVNGKEITLKDGQTSYTVDCTGDSLLTILPTAVNPNANIYVSDTYVSSGNSCTLPMVPKTRIIVQEEDKEPVIYILQTENGIDASKNAELSSLTLAPGNDRQVPDRDGKLVFTVPQNISSVRLTAVAANADATMTLSGEKLPAMPLPNGTTCETIALASGLNTFTLTVTSADGTVSKDFVVEISREAPATPDGQIRVSFTLTGDTKHYDTSTGAYTGEHSDPVWIEQQEILIPENSTAEYLTSMMLNNAGLSYTMEKAYLSECNGLSAFDNGPNSGWMFRHNGKLSQVGLGALQLKSGDSIAFFYTDDWRKETDIADSAVNDVVVLINMIDFPITLDSEASIKAARSAYDALTDTQKAQVTNYSTLTWAETEFAKLTATDEDTKAAKAVEDAIDAIGTVTLDSAEKIAATRKAYDSLSDLQKLLVGNYAALTAAEQKLAQLKGPSYLEIYKATGDALAATASQNTPTVDFIGGDWLVLGLARSGRTVPAGYYDNVLAYAKANCNEQGQLHPSKSTDNARVILTLTSIGKDVTDVAGHNLLLGLTDMKYLTKQGNSGPIWALIALNSHGYEIPTNGAAKEQVTREKLLSYILNAQHPDGSWALTSDSPGDSDFTGMALQALAPYYKDNATVKAAVDKALLWLSSVQTPQGAFGTMQPDGSMLTSSESTAQIIVALTALGIDPTTDSRFIKNSMNPIDALCRFAVDGGFSHTAGAALDQMATEQAYYALASYVRMLHGETALYDMSDVTIGTDTIAPPTGDMFHAQLYAVIFITTTLSLAAFGYRRSKKKSSAR